MWSLQGYAQLLFIMVCYFNLLTTAGVEGRKEMFYITTYITHFNMVIWRWTYSKERKPTASTTWATLLD